MILTAKARALGDVIIRPGLASLPSEIRGFGWRIDDCRQLIE